MKINLLGLLVLSFTFNLMAAQYEVPVAEELKSYSTFDLNDFDKKLDGDEVTIKYHLPELLVGDQPRIKLTGKIVGSANSNSVIEMSGDHADAKCVGSYASMKCVIEYHDLILIEEEVINIIKSKSLPPEEEAGRIQVMKAFSTDPVGIITY
jgi:hypothetical protein